jgi:hypothetical protein
MSDYPLLPEELKEPALSIFPSGPDGDYLEEDISLIWKGKSVVSLQLIPNGGIVRVFLKEDQSVYVWFKKTAVGDSKVTFSCLHLMVLSTNSSKQQKICCSYKISLDFDVKRKILGGGANITTLHAHGQLHFPKTSMVFSPSLPFGQKKVHFFFRRKLMNQRWRHQWISQKAKLIQVVFVLV